MSKTGKTSDNLDLSINEIELPESDFYEEIINFKDENLLIETKSTANFIKLTPAEQLELTRLYKKSNLLINTLESKDKISKQDKVALQNAKKDANNAMELLCSSCWRLAWLIVREQSEKRFGKEKATELLPDIMQEANAALVLSIRDFQEGITPNFHTYAAQVIRNHIRMVLSRDSYLRLAPAWIRMKRIASARIPELANQLGRNPTKSEIQESLLEYCLQWAEDKLSPEQKKLPKPQRKEIKLAKLRKQGMLGAIRDIDDVLIASQSPTSIDAPLTVDGPTTVGETIAADRFLEQSSIYEVKEMKIAISKALGTLTERERDVIVKRFGLDGDDPWTCSQLGDLFEISSERIRQIERTALAKLSSPHSQFTNLADFLHK
jgi:RNA polymerase sigma factor (sigma-70 family)